MNVAERIDAYLQAWVIGDELESAWSSLRIVSFSTTSPTWAG